MKTLYLSLSLLVTVSTQAQFPTASSTSAGLDPARLELLCATTK